MSKITVNDLGSSKDALNRLGTKDIPISIGLKIAIATETILDALKAPEKLQKQLLDKYGEKDKNRPDMVRIKPENIALYQEDMEALLKSEIEISLPDIKLSEFAETPEEVKKMKFQSADLIALKFLIQRDL